MFAFFLFFFFYLPPPVPRRRPNETERAFRGRAVRPLRCRYRVSVPSFCRLCFVLRRTSSQHGVFYGSCFDVVLFHRCTVGYDSFYWPLSVPSPWTECTRGARPLTSDCHSVASDFSLATRFHKVGRFSNDLTGFYRVLLGFAWFLLFFSWLHLSLSSFTGLNHVLPIFYMALLAFCMALLGFTGFYIVFLEFLKFYWPKPCFTDFFYTVLHGFTGFYIVLLQFLKFYWP